MRLGEMLPNRGTRYLSHCHAI